MDDLARFRAYLRAQCEDRGLSLRQLGVLCDVNPVYFHQAVNRNKENPPLWVLRRAARQLGVSYTEMLIAAGHLTEQEIDEWLAQRAANLRASATRA